MAQARALTTMFHDGRIYQPGDVFEYSGELNDPTTDGMEWVTKKTNAAFAKAEAEAKQALVDKAQALTDRLSALKAELEADPSRGDLVQQVLDAQTAADDAAKEVSAAESAE